MNKVIFNPPTPFPAAPLSDMTFRAPFQSVHIEISKPRSFGRTAGREGLGCEFYSESDGTLYSMVLDMNPYDIVDIPPMSLLQPIRNHIHAHATPGKLTLANYPNIDLVADGIWLYHPFGTALWSFDDLIIEPTQRFLKVSAQTSYVEVSKGVVVGFHRDTGALRCVFVEGFNCHQWVLGTFVSAETHGREFMDRLNFIHWNYYNDPELAPDIPNPIESLLLDPSLPKLLRDLIGTYIDSLNALPHDEHDE